MVFTDNGTKDLKLEREIVRLREAKKCEVYIVLTPQYEGYFNGKSLPAYGRMGQVGCLACFDRFLFLMLFRCFLLVRWGLICFSRMLWSLKLVTVFELDVGKCFGFWIILV